MLNQNIYQDEKESGFFRRREDSLNFMLGLAFVGTSLIFLIIVGVYINLSLKNVEIWKTFSLPKIFWVSTIMIALSSYTLHIAKKALEKDDFKQYRYALGSTFLLGISFCVMQILGWQTLVSINILFKNSLAGSFLYVMSGLHLLHIIGGLVFLGIIFKEALKYKNYVDAFVYSVNPPNQLKIKLIIRYWHFVDILWIVLFLFLVFQHS
ncbi:MAG: heme-copper oxidase subunit III [Bacteroidetes bacterium]|nr:MAG: heme-copper oxidase subunit III [Bacteroidota bacterium]